jgi:hypothetical protein
MHPQRARRTMAAKGTHRATAVGAGRRITLEIQEPGRGDRQATFIWEVDRSGRPKLDGFTSTISTISEAGERFVAATEELDVKAQGAALLELVMAVMSRRERDAFASMGRSPAVA